MTIVNYDTPSFFSSNVKMFIRNFKVNGKLIFKVVFIILLILILIMCGVGIYKIFNNKNCCSDYDNYVENNINVIYANNYTNVLRAVHNDLNSYIGMKIKFTGFIYRLYDFSEDQFVLARQMIISSDYQGVIVGFLCSFNGADKYEDGCWVEIEGTITKGNYHGEIPVIKIEKIKETDVPSEEYVYPPSENYVQTSEVLWNCIEL